MSEAAQHLRRVRSEFESHGIRNEVQITEHVAFLLLPQVIRRWGDIAAQSGVHVELLLQQIYDELQSEYSGLRIPQPPPARQWGVERLGGILGHLQNAFDASPHNANWGTFFQREIRFELLKGSSGSQYPTPYHIAELMAALVLTNLSAAHVFDPTAGSNGLLAACHAYQQVGGLTGCDFDPQWAGIGSAHLLLHGAENADYHVASALGYTDSYANRFNAVLMNPPFGGSRSAGEVAATIGGYGMRYGRSNATVLTALGLHVLQQNGHIAALVPSGVLFGGGGESQLRADLLQHRLEAVITLPENAFQPYSQVAAHLLIAQKSDPADAVWFCRLIHDGYPPGAGRDLTAQPNPTQNELLRARDLILKTRQNSWQTGLVFDNLGEIQTMFLGEADALPAVAIRLTVEAAKAQWTVIHLTSGLLVKLADELGQLLGWLYAPYTAESVQAMGIEQARAVTWESLFPEPDETRSGATQWQGSGDDVSLTITQGDTPEIRLKRTQSRTEFVFTAAGEQPGMACLLNAAGDPITSWLHLTGERRQDDIADKEFGANFGATAIEDAEGTGAGWLLELQAGNMENDETIEENVFLLIVTAAQGDLFPNNNGEGAIVFLENGWLRLSPQEATKFHVETGVQVELRQGVQVNGCAIGPAPVGSGGVGYSLFGVLVPRAEFVADDGTVGDLRPEGFLPKPQAVPPAHPMDVLARIRKSQTKLNSRVESLLQTLGQASRSGEMVETATDAPDWLAEMLSKEQQQFWDLLRGHQVNGRPRHFNLPDLIGLCQAGGLPFNEDEVTQQLQLFLRLGLVQPIHTQGHNLYRLVTTNDLM